MNENINWYPGHMKKTRELISANLKLVDVVVELIDARIPVASRNPIIEELVGGKHRIVVMNKADLADEQASRVWVESLKNDCVNVLMMNSMSGAGKDKLLRTLDQQKVREDKRPLRLMVVGVPNVGKSSFINRMTGKKSTQVGNRPGVTKGKQWLTLENGMQLLDTPGILWPKFEDQKTGLHLAFCGSIKDEIMDLESLSMELVELLSVSYPELLKDRYKLGHVWRSQGEFETYMQMQDDHCEDVGAPFALANMEVIAEKRGFKQSGGHIDYERTARTILDEFRTGKIGRITLEMP